MFDSIPKLDPFFSTISFVIQQVAPDEI